VETKSRYQIGNLGVCLVTFDCLLIVPGRWRDVIIVISSTLLLCLIINWRMDERLCNRRRLFASYEDGLYYFPLFLAFLSVFRLIVCYTRCLS
jgi:hypothetical protein